MTAKPIWHQWVQLTLAPTDKTEKEWVCQGVFTKTGQTVEVKESTPQKATEKALEIMETYGEAYLRKGKPKP